MPWKNIFRIIVYSCVLLLGSFAQNEEPCNKPLTSSLRDDQFSASSERNAQYSASAARISGDGWAAASGGISEYLHVDLGVVMELTAVDIQETNIGWYPYTFRITYSSDGYVWTGYNTRLSADSFGEVLARQSEATVFNLDPTIKTRYIAINPVSSYGYASLRLELYGCNTTVSTSTEFTTVERDIEVNTTWTATQSPILIDRPISVRSSTWLHIQAGVSVIFTKDSAGIDVYGTLSVEGLQGIPVLFSFNYPVLSIRSKWQGVSQGAGGYLNMTHAVIRQAITGLQGNGSRVKMAHCEIHSCEHGIQLSGGIERTLSNTDMIQGADMIFESINSHNNRYGLTLHGETSKPDIPIGYSNFNRNEKYGIYVSNWDGGSNGIMMTNLLVLGCNMNNNSDYGLSVSNRILTNLHISNSTFLGNRLAGMYYSNYYTSSANVTVSISSSNFVENRDDGVRIECYNCESSTHVFVNNTFRGHGQDAMEFYITTDAQANTVLTVSDSAFKENLRDIKLYIEPNVRAVIQINYFERSRIPVTLTGSDEESKVTLLENTFTAHASTYDDYVIQINRITANITNCTFANSSIPTIVRFRTGFDHFFAYNRFSNTSLTSCLVSVVQSYDPSHVLNIDYNFWGTSDMYEIKKKVCDFFLDSSKAVAKLSVFFPAITMETPTSTTEIDDFRFEIDGSSNTTIIGGTVQSSMEYFSLDNDQIIVNRSILIPDSVAVNISGITVHFANNRGIVVHGNLTIGELNTSNRTVIKHLDGEMWNGIKLYSKGIRTTNMDLTGTRTFLTVYGNDTAVDIRNCNLTDDTLQYVVYADMLNGNLSITINNTVVKTKSPVLYIKMNNTDNLDVNFTDSQFSSTAYVIELSDLNRQDEFGRVNLDVSNCSLYSSGRRVFYLASCRSHLTGTISRSNFSSSYSYYDGNYFYFPSMDVLVTDNIFGDGDETLYFRFCSQLQLPLNYSKVINITGNIFNSSTTGQDVTFYKYYTNERKHVIYITNNTFECKNAIDRRRVKYTGYTSSDYDLHSMTIDSNSFINSTGRLIDFTLGFDTVNIRNNVFTNNSQCIYISTKHPMNTFNISDNIFFNNSFIDGVILLNEIEDNSTVITNNSFVNNSYTVIAFRSSDLEIKYNFFENGEDVYNLKVLPDVTYSGQVVNVSLNYWGTTDVKEIAKTIYDNDYDDTLLDVVFRPYLGSRNRTDIQDEDAAFVSSAGEVGGTVNGNVTLTLDRSPYLVVSNVEVGKDDILTIEGGVELHVKEGLGIKVFGQLNALGTEDRPVRIMSEVSGSPWRGIELRYVTDVVFRYVFLNDTQEGLYIDVSRLTIHNVTSSYSQQTGLALNVYEEKGFIGQTEVQLSQVIVTNNGMDGIHVTGYTSNMTAVKIDECVVMNNTQNGVRIETDAEILFNNCVISNNELSGISLDQTGFGITYVNSSRVSNNSEKAIDGNLAGGLVLNLCNITGHNYGYFTYWSYWSTTSYVELQTSNVEETLVQFINTNFRDNVADGIYIYKGYYDRGKLTVSIEDCDFSGGNRTLVISDNSAGWISGEIFVRFVRNTVANNIMFHYRSRDQRLVSFVLGQQYEIEVAHNVFRNNTAETGLFLTTNHQTADGVVTVYENQFAENNFTLSTIDVQSYVNLELHRNIFKAPVDRSCMIDGPRFDVTIYINATYNFWGTSTPRNVVDRVCGFEKNMLKSFIWYIPYFKDENLVQTVSVDPDSLSLAGTFGGEMKSDMVISKDDFPTPIQIDRSILIREGAVVTVEAGVVLNFESYRGIYVQGTLQLLGGDETIVLDKTADAQNWYGVMINSSSQAVEDKTMIVNTVIQHTMYGVVFYSQNVEIKRSSIINTGSPCLTVYKSDAHRIYDFGMTRVEQCVDFGISLVGDGAVTVMNVAVKLADTGIGLNSRRGSVEIRSVNISECRQAVSVTYSDSNEAGNITVESCLFSNCSRGLTLSSQNRYGHNSIRVSRNTFRHVAPTALSLEFPTYHYYYANSRNNRTVDVSLNTFLGSCGVTLKTWNDVNLTVRDNVFRDADCTYESDYFLFAHANGNQHFTGTRLFDISTNLFQNISSKSIVLLKDNSPLKLDGTFVYNQMLGNLADDGVVGLDALQINVSQNIFDNPATSFDVYAYKRGPESVNVTNNWWGSSDANQVYDRIFDQRRNPDMIFFNVSPALTERQIDCSGVNNCSSQGECVSPDRCRCYSGWTGESCMDYDCAGVSGCYGNGKCTGPNVCECFDGWSGNLCIVASCVNVNNCSGHGICIRPDVCTCAVKFTGNDCSSCVPLHWGAQCRPCPDCKHGTCNLQNGLCDCAGDNWSGYLCDRCSEAFYGPDCLPLIKVLDIVPNQGRDKGGNLVHVWGHNFPETIDGTYTCRFGTEETNGTWLAWNHVACVAPQHPEGEVTIEISPDGLEFTNDLLTYVFYATCPPGACGRDFSPSRGQCLFGGCSCFLPWTGENCNRELFAPVIIRSTLEQTIEESSTYSAQLNLQQGDAPVLWSLLKGPSGMTINERTGAVSWRYVYADSRPYEVEVRASNIIGQDTVSWKLTVPLSYSVNVENIEPSGVFPVPRPVQIFGTVTFSSAVSERVVPIDIIVTSTRDGRETLIQELSDPLAPTAFRTTYFPRPDDAGLFSVVARHPGDTITMGTNVTWSVLGMRCEPSTITVSKKILSDDGTVIISGISALVNIGNMAIGNISAEVNGLPGAFVRNSGVNDDPDFLLTDFQAGDQAEFDLVITNARPLSGIVYVVFTSEEGTSTRLRVFIRLSIQRPNLIFDPPSLGENIVRGNIRIFDVRINNTGEVAAENVDISLPEDPRLSLVSFTTIGGPMVSNYNHTIPPGAAAQISIAVTTENNAALGEMSGTIYINSELSSDPFRYRFYITSLEKFNMTFIIKDEYTYFAAGSPLVSNAKVRLVNPRRGYSETKYTTNETGYVVFENVYEDQYSVYAEAEGHSSYGAVILVTPDTTDQDIFLQRVAVRYTWTVEPTTVEDIYIIQLESTFETYVPMPVVTIEPAKVNTIPLELEEIDTIDFNITNHGLIRADNVRFALPTGHPYLNFESTVDFIGSVEANTSIIVPVRATLKTRVKRNVVAAAICGFLLLYDYECGTTQTRSLDVTLTRNYPGRPPLPCGLGGGVGIRGGYVGGGGVSYSGEGSGTGSGSSVTYNPTTPLSCDCAKTLIKSCALAFHPIAGCAMAVVDLGTSFARSGGSVVVGTLNAIVGLADTAFACVFGVVCSLCGLFYTAVSCLVNVALNCGGARRRRDISTEVVNNMITTAGPMDNFLHMMNEILGDEGMYNLGSVWYPAFKKTVGEDSELGTLLSNDEAASVLDTLTEQASKTNLSRFLERWNNTAAAWENGTLNELEDTSRVISLTRLTPRIEQYLIDVESAEAKGFDSIFDEFDHAANTYRRAEQQESSSSGGSQRDGVCARVRVRIVQELVLTRDAFNARLEIENGETSDLESIQVEIYVKQTFGTGELTNDKFSIGEATLVGISGVDGSGTLGRDLSGSAEWLIIPYSNAAPEDDTQYDVGGRLSYTVGGSEFSVPLLPDTITVKPNPSLVVHYFHEKYVRGDDALTPEVEPSVPFSLAVTVMNNGYGVARGLKITSGQPEIIENEKGLLIAFRIIGAQLGNNPITPSLSVDFGDISSFETKSARWLLTSTIMGTFYNYSATFENINPLGDPQLSLLDELGYHELIHVVRIELPDQDDGLDDFLVNDFVDGEGMPDRLYNSANGSYVADVTAMNVTDVKVTIFSTVKQYKFVTVTVVANTSIWVYARPVNTFTSPDPADKEYLLHAEAADGRELLVDTNVWQTTHILDNFYLHIFDFIPSNNSDDDNIFSEVEFEYSLVYGPRNMYAPRFNSSAYSATVSKSRNIGFEVTTIHAYDIDKDRIVFNISNANMTQFTVSAISDTSAVIKVNQTPLEPGLVKLVVVATDSGIPSRSTSINVTIQVSDTGTTDTTKVTTVTNVTTPTSATVTPETNTTTSGSTTVSAATNATTSVSQNATTSTSSTTSTPTSSASTTQNATTSTSSTTSTTTSSASTTQNATTSTSSTTSTTLSSASTTQDATTSPSPTTSTTISSVSTSASSSISTSPSEEQNTTTTVTEATNVTTASSTFSSTGMSTNISTQTSVSQSTNGSTSTIPSSSTTPADGIQDEQEGQDVPRWIIPMSLGIAVLVIVVVVLVCAIRKKP